MSGLARAAWQFYKRNFGAVVGPLWITQAILAALARAYLLLPDVSRGYTLLLIEVLVPMLIGTVVLAVVTVRIESIDRGERLSIASAWTRLGSHRSRLALMALLPTLVALLLAIPTGTRLLVLLLFNGFFGPPLVMHALALEGRSGTDALTRARELLRGRGPRTVLYLVNVVVGTGLVSLFVGGAIFQATTGTGTLELVAIPVQTLVAAIALGYVGVFEYVLFQHLTKGADATPG